MRALGADLIEHGDDFQAAREEATRVADESGLVRRALVSSRSRARRLDLRAGVVRRRVPISTSLYVPIGQGSGICGCIAARDALGLKTEIVGVQASGAPAYALSFAAGRAVATKAATRSPTASRRAFPTKRRSPIIRRGAARIVLVDDDEIAARDPRLLDRHPQSRRRRRRRAARRRVQGARPTRRQEGRPRAFRRQHRPRPVPALGGARRTPRADSQGIRARHGAPTRRDDVMTKIETKPEPDYPPSPYSSPIGKSNIESHTLSVLVDNEPGVLARVVGLFSARSFNIESLTVAEVAHETHQSRITIVTSGTPEVVEQVRHQLERLVPIHSVTDLTEDRARDRARTGDGQGARQGRPAARGAAARRGVPRQGDRRDDGELHLRDHRQPAQDRRLRRPDAADRPGRSLAHRRRRDLARAEGDLRSGTNPSPVRERGRGEGLRRDEMTSEPHRFARRLRRASTSAEDILWARLRGSRLHGAKFRRQVPIDRYVVDFCCHAARLIVEIDGAQHDWQTPYDDGRTQVLESAGFNVLRFTNEDVRDDLESVLQRIRAELRLPFV